MFGDLRYIGYLKGKVALKGWRQGGGSLEKEMSGAIVVIFLVKVTCLVTGKSHLPAGRLSKKKKKKTKGALG